MYLNKFYMKMLALFLGLIIFFPPIAKATTFSVPNNLQVLQNPSTLSILDDKINSPLKIMVPEPSLIENTRDGVEKVKAIYTKVEERNKKDNAVPLPPGGASMRKAINRSSLKSSTPVTPSKIVTRKVSSFATSTASLTTATPTFATSSLPASAASSLPASTISSLPASTAYSSVPITPAAKALAIAVQYPDKSAITPISHFQNLLFGDDFGTLRDYYRTVSKGSFVPDGKVVGLNQDTVFITLPHEKNYYSDDVFGFGSYPKNVQGLVADAVQALIAVNFDWSPYRNSDNEVPYLFVIHAGLGHESSYDKTDVHSCSWALNQQKIIIGTTDTTEINYFTIEPELSKSRFSNLLLPSTLGVYAHEFGHSLGLPDLYDPTYMSDGIGNWSLMSRGSWAGPNRNGEVPVELDCWSKAFLGWATPEVVPLGTTSVTIPQIESSSGKVLLLNTPVPDEHFLVENRQKTSYDKYLDGSGLLIWHIDSSIANPNSIYWLNNTINATYINATYPPHHGISLIEADGYHNLDYADSNYGDSSDPFPGTENKREIQGSNQEDPNLSTWDYQDSGLSLTNISDSNTTMTASVTVWDSLSTAVDTVKPVITLNGASKVVIPVNTTYIDPGATASDDIDGDLTSNIEVTNLVDTTKVGIYTIHYNVSDFSGNPADEMFRTVQVEAEIFTAKPVVQIGVNPSTNSTGLFIGIKDIKDDKGTIINDKTLTSYQLELDYDPTKASVLDVYNELNLGTLVKTTNPSTTNPSNSTVSITNTFDQGSPNFDKLVFVPIVLTGSATDSTIITVKFIDLTDEGMNKVVVSDPVELKFQRGKILNSLSTLEITITDALAGLQYLAQTGSTGLESGTGLEEGQVNLINMASILEPTGTEVGVRPNVKHVIALLQYLVQLRDGYFRPI